MDKIEDLAKQASQLTFYDIKSYYNQAKNMVLNVSEMEAKVREATNEDAWGASSTLMQEIAQGTHNFQHFNEIMPTIYSRFMEKEAREWRQIYKALTLLEYLVKHGSERVVDDARSHISTVKMLKSFHYIDEKGKDQGINVRNRAKEIADLLADVDRIRQERRKAKANRNKYGGTGNDGAAMSFTSGGSRYGGFGSETLGGASASGGYEPDSEYRRGGSSSQRPASFDEYEGADDFDEQPPRRSTTSSRPPKPVAKSNADVPKPKAKEPEVDLFSFGDDEPVSSAPAVATQPLASLDDDFDDFQEAAFMAPAPAKPAGASSSNAGLFDLLDSNPPQSKPAAAALAPSMGRPAQPPMYTSSPSFGSMSAQPMQPRTSVPAPAATPAPAPAAPAAKGASGFDDLWLGAFGGAASKPAANSSANKTIKDLEKEKAQASLWGPAKTSAPAPAPAAQAQSQSSNGFDDLLL